MALKYLYAPSGVQAEKAYGVLPNSANADFSSFSRSSAGSRVDKNGLINTGLGLGSEEIVNGDFDTDSDWTKGTGWSISGGKAVSDGTSGLNYLTQSNVATVGKAYEIKITVSDYVSGEVQVSSGTAPKGIMSAVGDYTFRLNATGTTFFITSNSFNGSVDNVSVREITEVNTDVPRLDYTGGGCPSLLLEPTSTNYMKYSEDFSDVFYSKFNSSVSDYIGISPQGTYNAKTITDSGAGGSAPVHFNRYSIGGILPSDGDYAYSIFAKKGTRKICRIEVGNLDGIPSATVNFNLDTGEIVSTSGTAFNSKLIEPYKDGWYKLSVTLTISNKQNNQFIRFRLLADDGGSNLTLDGTNTMHFFGAQVEQQSYATSYIPNYGTAAGVTRSADNAGSTGDLSNVINSSEGVLYVNVAALSSNGSSRRITLNNGTTSNRLIFQYSSTSNQINYYFVVGGTNQCSMSHTLSNAMDYSKVALKYKENDFALWVNGVEVGTENSGNTLSAGTLNSLNFDGATGNYPFYGRCKEIRIYDEALNDAEMVKLTTL